MQLFSSGGSSLGSGKHFRSYSLILSEAIGADLHEIKPEVPYSSADLNWMDKKAEAGLSSHTPALANRVLDMGVLDMLMFSINPGYDYRKGDYGIGDVDERMALYRSCEKEGVRISVMKAFSGGQLLDAKTSPFGQALTEYQCLQYALDKPEETDYSVIGNFAPQDANGKCVYCNHCKPCPQSL